MTPARARRARAVVRALAVLAAAVVLGLAWAPGPSVPAAVSLGGYALTDTTIFGIPINPPAPTGVGAVPHDRSALVSWNKATPNTSTVVSYRVYVGGTLRTQVPGTQASATVTGLTNYQVSPQITVRTFDSDGRASGDSNGVTTTPYDDVAPAAVTGLVATRGDGRVTLTWEPESGAESDRAGVRVYVEGALRTSLPAATTTYDVTGLTNDREYAFYLVAYDARPNGYGSPPVDGPNASGPSATVKATPTDLTPPSAPTAFTAVRGDTTAALTWTAPPENDVGLYKVVDENGVLVASFTAPATSGTATAMTNGRAYRLRLVAVDTHGNHSPASAETTVTPATPPVARPSLTAARGDSRVDLAWQQPPASPASAAAVSVRVLVDGALVATLPGSATSYAATGLDNDQRYTFTLVGVDDQGRPGPPATVEATPTDLTPPPVPTGLTVVRGGSGELVLTWTAVVAADLAGYEVVDADGTVVRTVTAGTTTVAVGGLTNGAPYEHRLRALDTHDNRSAPSTAVTKVPLDLPAVVTGLAAEQKGQNVKLTWDAPVPPPSGVAATEKVRVYRVGTPAGSPDVLEGTVDVSKTSFTVNDANGDPPPAFYVRALDEDGRESALSQTVSAALGVPQGVSATSGTQSARVTWSAVPGAEAYRVERHDGSAWVPQATVTGTSLDVTGLTDGTQYTFRVIATAPAAGTTDSAPSASVTITAGYTPPTTVPAGGSGGSIGVAASRDGRYAVMAVAAGGGKVDLVRVDRLSADRVTVAAGVSASEPAFARAAVSDDGRYVALLTRTSHSPRVTNGRPDVYRYDTATGAWALVSAPAGTGAQFDTTAPVPGLTDGAFSLPSRGPRLAITADGSRVFFTSARNNLVAGDTNGGLDVFAKDLATGTVTRVTPAGGPVPTGTALAITPDGAYVLYAAGSGGNRSLVRQSVTTPGDRVTVTGGVGPLNPLAGVGQLAISDDGRRVLATTVSSTTSSVVQADLSAPTPPPAGAPAGATPTVTATTVTTTDYGDGQLAITPDGAHAFVATREALLPADTNGHVDVYRVDLADPSVRVLVTAGPDGGPAVVAGQGGATLDEAGSITARDADHVVVVTQRPLITADGNGARDAYAVDLGAPAGSRAHPLVGGP